MRGWMGWGMGEVWDDCDCAKGSLSGWGVLRCCGAGMTDALCCRHPNTEMHTAVTLLHSHVRPVRVTGGPSLPLQPSRPAQRFPTPRAAPQRRTAWVTTAGLLISSWQMWRRRGPAARLARRSTLPGGARRRRGDPSDSRRWVGRALGHRRLGWVAPQHRPWRAAG